VTIIHGWIRRDKGDQRRVREEERRNGMALGRKIRDKVVWQSKSETYRRCRRWKFNPKKRENSEGV
jgi:hypothetical protein